MGQVIAGWDLDEFADLDYSPTNSPPADDVWGDTFNDLGAKPKPVPQVATPEVDPLADKYAAAYQEIARRSKAATAPDGTQLDPPPDATELETLTARRARELATGIPHDDNVEQLRIAYENEVSPELKKKRLVDYQVAQRYIGERRKGLEEDRKEIKDRGITIDRKIQEEYSKVEAGLGPDMMLANAPIMRGAMTGVSNAASGIAETSLRILPGAGAPSRMADTLGRSRNAEGQRQALLDEQQGAALALPNQVTQMVGEYLPLSAVGVPAYLQVGAQGANDAYTKSKSDVYALTSGIFQGAMTYAGGKLADGTFIDMLSGKVAGKALGPMLKGFGIESAEELGQLYGQALLDKGFGVGDGSMPTVKDALWTLATVVGARGFGSVMSAGIEDDGVKPQPTPEEKALKALRDFAAQSRPSRAAAEKAGVNQVATTAKDRAALANDMRNQAVTAPSVPPPAQESQQVAPPVDQTAQTPQPAVAPDSPPTSAILDDLASRHPEVAQALAGPTGTPEFASIREHTDVVLDRFTKSGASTGVPELDAVMPTIIALHDIGKPAAIAKGNKNLQHAETLPILERVMRAEGATDQQVEFAKTLVGQDIIGQLVKGQIDVAQAEVEMFARASEAGISPQQFHTIAAAMYNADAGSYSRLSHLFDDKGRLTDIDSRVLEEVVHGKVSSIPWSEDYRSGGQRSADAGSDGGNVYTHSSAYDFTRFDSSKDAGNNLAGPGAYLLPDGQQHIADVYKRRATAKMLSVFGPRDRSLIVKAINAKNTKQFNAWIAFLQKRQAEAVDQKRKDTYGRAADVMAVIRDNPGGKTLEFSFDPKNTLDLGTRKFGGRHLPKKVRSALVAAAKAVNPNFEPTTSPKAWDLYHQMQREFGYANVNKIVQAAGFDSIGFVHEGNRALGGPRYPVMVALDHGAPTRVQPGQKRAKPPAQKAAAKQQSQQPQQQVPPPPPATPPPVAPPVAPPVQPPPAPPGPPPTTDNLNQTQQNASGIPMDRDTRAAFTRNFIKGLTGQQFTELLKAVATSPEEADALLEIYKARASSAGESFDDYVGKRVKGVEKTTSDKSVYLKQRDSGQPDALAQPAYHASPYKFDKFTTDKIGTTNPNESAPWGLYFAGNEQVARYYKEKMVDGNVYRVDLKPSKEEYLDWEKPLSKQSDKVKQAIQSLVDSDWIDADIYAKGNDPYGADVYEAFAKSKDSMGRNERSAKLATKRLVSAGVRGILQRGDASDSAESRHYVIFDGADAVIEEVLAQKKGRTPRGEVQFLKDEGTAIIRAFEGQNLSTLLHETGHLFRRDLSGEDLAVAERWAGARGGKWNHKAEEKFARGFERYLRDGVAPTKKLASVFTRFKDWLSQVYSKLSASPLNVDISPEMRQVFDRLLTPQQVETGPVESESGISRDIAGYQSGNVPAPPGPPPVQPPPAPAGPPPTTDNLNQTQQNAAGIPMDRDTRAAFTRNFISGGNQDQITRDLVYRRDSIIRKHTAKIFQGTRDLRRAVKAARHAAGKRIWNKNTPANLTDEALNDALADPTLIPTLPLKVGVEIQKIRDHIDSLTDQIQMLGGITPDMFLVLEGNKGKYITRTFKKFEDVIGWRKFALNDPTIMADFAAEVRQDSPNATDREIRSLAEELLRRDTLRPTGLTSTSSTQAYVNILERRKDLSPAVRQLYGENKNIFDNYAATVGQMASTIAHRGFIENLKRDGLAAGTFSEVGQARNKPDHVQQVSWDKIPQLAPLKGVLMTPEMAVALNDLYGMPGTTGFLSILASGSSAVKASKTIGAFPRAFIRNFLGNIPISIANGNWNVISGVKAIGETGLEYFDKQDDATKKKWERLVELGVVESFTVDELRDAAKASNAALKSWAGMIPGSRAAKALVKGSARTYQAMDTVSKIHNYQSELKTLQKAYPGKPLFELEEEAAKITRALNPTYDEASKAARYWSRYVPLGSFAMFSAEIYRTTGNRMMRAAYEVKTGVKERNATLFQQGMKRVAGQLAMTLLTGAAADLLQEWWGTKLSPEQEKAFRDNLPPWQKHSNIIVTQVDEEGNPISYADLGYNDPFGVFPKMINALAAGESDEAALQLVEPFVTEDILAGALLSLWRGRDEQDRPIYTEGVSKERQWMERIAFLAKKAEPGTVTSLRRFKDAVQGKTTKSGAPLSVMNEVISNLGGMRIDRFDRDTAGFYRNREYEQKIKDSQTAISKAFSGKGTFDPDEARAIWHDAHAVREQSMKEWKGYMEGLRLLGEKEPFAKVVRDTTSNSLIAQQAYTGNVSPYEFTQDALGRMLKLPQGEQRLDLLRELYAEAAAGKDEPALPASPFRQ